MLTKRHKYDNGPLSNRKIKCLFWFMFNFWWLAEWSEQKTLTEMQKNEKGHLSHWKIKCLFLDYVQLLMIGQAIWAKTCWPKQQKKWKRPPKSSKNKMFVFGLRSTSDDQPMHCFWAKTVQLLMMSQAIWAKTVNRNAKKWRRPPKSSKNKMFIFGLCSTSDDWPSDLSK